MITIKKVLNSSVVLVNKDGQEMIAFGKGIGYGKQPEMVIAESAVDKLFLSIENFQAQQMMDLINTIPPVYFEITQEISDIAGRVLNNSLSISIYYALTDHIHFAVERFNQGILLTNRVFWEIKNYYPKEFQIGIEALKLIENRIGCSLPEEEAASIAFHIINAESKSNVNNNAMKYAKMIGSIVNLVRYNIRGNVDTHSIHYTRFITHVKFFVERFYSELEPQHSQAERAFFEHIATLYPEAINVAFKVRDYLKHMYDREIDNDELTYLTVHINRLMKTSQEKQ